MYKFKMFCALVLGAILSALCLFFLPSPVPVDANTSKSKGKTGPVIVELFTSEGCSSCPPADELLSELIADNGANIAPLSEHVSYWNYIGWNDPYSSSVFDRRQYKYVSLFGLNSAYTPQVIVNGVEQTVGNNGNSVRGAIAKALKAPPLELPLSTSWKSATVLLVTIDPEAIQEQKGEITLAVTESGLTSNVRAGENVGHVLKHDAVVRALKSKLLTNSEHDQIVFDIEMKPAWNKAKLNLIAFLQQPGSGLIQYSQIVPASKWK
jgi:hypothetical protein